MAFTFEETKVGYGKLWRAATVRSERVAAAKALAQKVVGEKSRYLLVEQSTGVPWFVVGVLHYRESDFNFGTYLGNGQSLLRITTEVPVGRGPFASFGEGAIDALQGLKGIFSWTIERILFEVERFNGQGYFSKGNSPYVWSWTDQYQSGKFTRDHFYDPSVVDSQCGCAAMLKELEEMGAITLKEETTDMPTAAPAVSNANAVASAAHPSVPFVLPQVNFAQVEASLATITNVLPLVATFFPPLRVALPFMPILAGVVKMAEEIQAAHASGGDIASVLAAHLEMFAAQVRALNAPSA